MSTLIFIPGHWNTPACYPALFTALLSYGYKSGTVILPFPGCDAATYDFASDIDAVKETLENLSQIRRDVILVLHPAHRRSTAKPVGERPHIERTLEAGVARMLFFMAYISAEGFQQVKDNYTNLPQDPAEFELEVCYKFKRHEKRLDADNVQRGTVTESGDGSMSVGFQYLPASEAQHWATRLLPQSVGAFWTTSNYTGWDRIPDQYVLRLQSRSCRVPYAHYKLEKTRKISGMYADVVANLRMPIE